MEEGKAYQIEARPKDTVKTLKAVLNLELGFAEQAIQLSFDGKVLSDEMELTEVDLKEGSKLQMEVVEVTEEAVSSSSGEGDAWIRCFWMFFVFFSCLPFESTEIIFLEISLPPKTKNTFTVYSQKKHIFSGIINSGIQGRHSDFHQSGLSRQDHQADLELRSRGGD